VAASRWNRGRGLGPRSSRSGAVGAADGSDRRSYERLAIAGGLVSIASLVLPWYRIPAADRFEKSGIGSFDFAEAALLITIVSCLALIVQVRRGHRPPLPMHEGSLLALGGVWASLIVVYLMFDRPQETIFDFPADYGLRYGIFVALGGALILAFAGMRVRRLELTAPAAEEEAAGPSAASPTRSPR
jgi:hypothetical protein